MEAVAVIIALTVALFVTLAVLATVKAVKAVKRGVDHTVTQARRTVEDTRLKAMQFARPGPAGEVAQLRLSLRTSMRATQEALRERSAEDASLSESLALFQRLSGHGRELDEELRRLESEPSQSRIAQSLPELRKRTDAIRESADALRWAAQDRARQFQHEDLADLGEQIRMEASALRHWTAVEEEGAPGAAASPKSASGPSGAERTGQPGQPGQPERPERQRSAIPGRPSWLSDLSWEKRQQAARRPESAG
ncbi:hypothetical protein [Streptomyces orinoci]|uniref:Secreted protein n=1 Tax=Streptomyces orinoci TaxID=67339 RepID=A0ABV3JQC7_STRON|nr:hypothetical protein [Streptomyces orinoci]